MVRRSLTAFIACASLFTTTACGIKGPLKPPVGAAPPPLTGAPPGVIPPSSPDSSLVPGSAATSEAGKDK
jgi:predicted small lipoprotein YifL